MVSQRSARTIQQVGIGHGPLVRQRVGEIYPRHSGRQESEARFARGGNPKRRTAEPGAFPAGQGTAAGRPDAGWRSNPQKRRPNTSLLESHSAGTEAMSV